MISLTDRRTTVLNAAASAASPATERGRHTRPRLSARMATELIIAGYGCVLALLGIVAAQGAHPLASWSRRANLRPSVSWRRLSS